MADEFCLKMPDFHVTFRDLLHAVNLRHGTNGFTSPPKEGVLRVFFSPWKIQWPRSGLNTRTWVPKTSWIGLDTDLNDEQELWTEQNGHLFWGKLRPNIMGRSVTEERDRVELKVVYMGFVMCKVYCSSTLSVLVHKFSVNTHLSMTNAT